MTSFYTIPKNLYIQSGTLTTVLQTPYRILFSTVFKPPLGCYDFIFCIIKGIGTTIFPDYSMLRFRRRPPRIFGEDGLLIPYNYDHAVGNDYILRLGYKVTDNEEFKHFESAHFRLNGKTANFAIILTDRRLYIVVVKQYTVERYCQVKLHRLKSVEVKEMFDGTAEVDVRLHVRNEDGKILYKMTRMEIPKAKEFVQNIRRVMETLRMDIDVKADALERHGGL